MTSQTILFLHGFSSNGAEFRDKILPVLPADVSDHRLIFPNARIRPISCYGGARVRSWHDYRTNYGDNNIAHEEDVQDIEESILDLLRLKPSLVVGESQGACVAYEVGRRARIPTVMLYGQRYSMFPQKNKFPLKALVGMHDCVIPSSVSLPRMPKFAEVTVINSSHAEMNEDAELFLQNALRVFLYAPRNALQNF